MTTASETKPTAAERTYSGITLSERAAQRRQTFIEVGIQLIGKHGYHATTMRMLTAESGLTNRYFYQAFDNMEDLLVACYETLMADFRAELQRTMNDSVGQLEDRIRAGLTCFFAAMRDENFARITHSEVLGVSERVDALYNRCIADFADLLMSNLMTSDDVAPAPPRQMKYIGVALVGSLSQAGIAWLRNRYNTPLDDVVSATTTVFIGTLHQLKR